MPKCIFLDGDGTLWYPSLTKRTDITHWIYLDPNTKDEYLKHLELCPGVYTALSTLYMHGFQLILLSMSPKPEAEALQEHKEKLDYFNLTQFFTSWHAAPAGDPESKPRIIKDVLSQYGYKLHDAIMVGDSIKYDYQPVIEHGITSYLIESDWSPDADNLTTDTRQMQTISEVADLLTLWNLSSQSTT
ncbi:MAG: HAD family hydrolase [Candidatus Paceibacteria bacterium]